MRICYYCKASKSDGVGHFVRSSAVVTEALRLGHSVAFIVEADPFVKAMAGCLRDMIDWVNSETEAHDLLSQSEYSVIVFDMLHLDECRWENTIRDAITVSLSPVFNLIQKMDYIFHRTKYVDENLKSFSNSNKLFASLQYAVTGEHFRQIDVNLYTNELEEDRVSIAIAMGGADSENRSSAVLRYLCEVETPLIIWVVLGNGYSHSLDKLTNLSNGSHHEVVLVRSNKSVWRILRHCSLAILAGGITTYEAASAGLPSINILSSEDRYYLIKELVEIGAALYTGTEADPNILHLVNKLITDKDKLLKMHHSGKNAIGAGGAERIARHIYNI